MTFDRRAELGEFLRSRRARLRPEEFGLTSYGRQRRVPGLRREELAQLAGVSVDHYVRLEQGRSLQFSVEVLDAVAKALRLDPAEREHLHRLARPTQAEEQADTPPLRPGIHSLLSAINAAPAYVVDRRTDVRAWNRLAAAFITDFGELAPAERNMARLVFFDEDVRALYVDWWARARDVVAFLRLDLARPPVPPATQALIEDLSAASPEFRQIWAEHDIKAPEHGSHLYRHPLVGELELSYETLQLPGHPDLALVVHTAEEGTPSQEALRILATS
ncbi:helix-turn-helix domain-containing protein [Actinomadura barringtoniae]|uniref:Helix-turn-helix domain-containing protein n=1 Tax=Actinomadura barringtoniae TaxID=1427535 RepID=A0A939PQQ5_9ACTN|nr:helix-turn-helix transcriptional regulator [Actinomadura barringtoniae]MBO2454424.1 helix-turn-helix domain-containing protein [Actinomadura barringtoniae]